MKQAGLGLLTALALMTVPVAASGQPAFQGRKAAAAADKKATDKKAAGAEAAAAEEEAPEEPEAAEKPEGGESIEDICKIDPDACPVIDMEAAAKRNIEAEMYAVQQIYALRARRFEFNLYGSVTMNDQFVGHPGPGLGINYYITNVMAAGINGNWYGGLNSQKAFNFETSRASRIGMPITEYQWNANANFTYVPAYGKFAGFGNFIFHYDIYLLVGVGAISTRPIAVVDPDNRSFEFEPTVTFGGGGGIRIFFNRWLAAMLEIRDYIFFDRLENPSISTGYDATGRPNAQDESTWLKEDRSFTNNVQAQLGLSIFVPFTWEYRLPK
ncbi:MAG: outer membrane beta-barrel domain-containing protein [Deltaproteobacteria bacterium]|nr:outer membrane beta-barrel domain-containing protein [Deltaproteobacteria bacterium]